MTAKEKVLKEAMGWSEAQAERALEAAHADSAGAERWLGEVPEDDEPLTPEEAAAVEESDGEIATGRASSLDDTKKELEIK